MAAPSSLGIDDVRRLWGRARYDPDRVDAERLVTELFRPSRSDPFGGVIARASARLAAADPDRTLAAIEAVDEEHVVIAGRDGDRYATLLDRHLGTAAGSAVARTLAHVGAVDESASRRLEGALSTARMPGLADAVEGVRQAAETEPAAARRVRTGLVLAVADATGPPGSVPREVDYAGDRNRRGTIGEGDYSDASQVVEDGVAALVASLETDAVPGEYLRQLLDDEDPGRRACGVRLTGAAAGEGVAAAVDEVPRVVDALEDSFHEVRRNAIVAVGDAAGTAPDLLPDEVEHLLSVRGSDRTEAAATDALADLACAEPAVFESLLELVADGSPPMADSLGGLLGWADRDRAMVAVADAAAVHPERLQRHQAAIDQLCQSAILQAARCVENAGEAVPEVLEAAVDPLFDAVDRYHANDCDPFYRALATLASEYQYVADGIVAGLARDSDQVREAAAGCRHLAETAPQALLDATAEVNYESRPVSAVELLERRYDDPEGGVGACRALARLGRRYPDAVEDLAWTVADRLELGVDEADREWVGALYELAGVLLHVDPLAFESVGLSVVTNADADVAVPYVSSWCAEYPDAVPRVAERIDDDEVGLSALRSLAVAAGNSPSAVAPVVGRLLEATDRRHWRERRAATRAVACAVTAPEYPTGEDPAVDRLAELVYDPEASIRRWAAFGLGERLAEDATTDRPAMDRLQAIADSDDEAVAPVATLALVRAGGRPAGGVADVLRRVATREQRPIASVAVDVLEGEGDRESLQSVRSSAEDPRIRREAERSTR